MGSETTPSATENTTMTADNQVTVEPVAWMYQNPEGQTRVRMHRAKHYRGTETPLYTQPAINSGGEVERVARAIDPDAWQEDLPVPTRAHTIAFHADRAKSIVKARAAIAAMNRAPGVDMPERIANRMGATFVPRPETIDGVETGNTVVPNTPEPRPVEAGEGKLLADLQEVLGALTPGAIERADLDGMAFTVKAAIEHLRQQSLSAARAEIEGLDWKDAKAIAACVVQNACETDPADAEHPDTILITTDDLETIVRSAIEDYEKPRPSALSTDQGREGEA